MKKAQELKAKGTVDRAKGKTRQAYGKLTGDKRQQAKGFLEEGKGRVKQSVGSAASKGRAKR